MAKGKKPKQVGDAPQAASKKGGLSMGVIGGAAVAALAVGVYFMQGGGAAGGGGRKSKASKAVTPEPDYKIFDPASPWEETVSRSKFKSVDAPWKLAREQLLKNKNAVLLAANPDVWVVPDFLSSPQSDNLMEYVTGRYEHRLKQHDWCFEKSYGLPKRFPGSKPFRSDAGDDCTTDAAAGQQMIDESKRSISRSTMVAKSESDAADVIGEKIEAEAGLALGHAFHSQVLEYVESEEYTAHKDCNNAQNDRGGTALVYLTDVEEGGETCFPRRGICVKPRKGAAVFFQSLDSNRRCDPKSEHIAKKVTKGTKTVLQRWYYTSYTIPTGDRDSVLCDLGNNCRHYMYDQTRVKAVALSKEGEKLKAAGDMAGAEAKFKAAVESYPTHPYAAAWYGEILYNKGQLDEAKVHFENSIKSAPYFPDAHYFLGDVYRQQNNPAKSAEHYGRVVNASPRDQDAWFMLGSMLSQIPGKEAEAVDALVKHLRINPGDNEAKEMHKKLSKQLK